jgi:hypothetical protein
VRRAVILPFPPFVSLRYNGTFACRKILACS